MSDSTEVIDKTELIDLSKEELVFELKKSRLETFKYVNRLLEVQEKWTFINLLLKKLNSIKDVNILCNTICDGFFVLTNSKISACYLFNMDTGEVDFKEVLFKKKETNESQLMDFISKINADCKNFVLKAQSISQIEKYFEEASAKNRIIVPITCYNHFLGYLLLAKDEENFYNENIRFVDIFPEHIALILSNISLYQESEKSNKRKIEFLAGIAHEFKTPLNSIIGFAQIVKDALTEKKQVKYLENITQSSKHLLGLLEDILDVSKSQFNSLELNYTKFSTKEEILKVVSSFEKMIEDKNIELDYTLCNMEIFADIKRFKQLIFNLISNAIKFNKVKGKIIIITYVKDEKFFFEITDNGDGISKQDYEKIFDFFSQVNRNQLKRELGSGVGLAICKIITAAHCGDIDFKSQVKKGSSFWFSLPICK